jgi:hypothetical protein
VKLTGKQYWQRNNKKEKPNPKKTFPWHPLRWLDSPVLGKNQKRGTTHFLDVIYKP